MNSFESNLLDVCISVNDFESYFRFKNFTRNDVKYKFRIKSRSASFS